MRIGVVFPQTEIGPDPGIVREYAQAAEAAGFAHLLAYDHVLGADTRNRPDWSGPYRLESQFHEVLVLFGFLAGVTTTLELVAGVVILPQRQTALVAKQAAEVDVLSGGRLRLGVGIGWNEVEYTALGEEFASRGRRIEEQITVLRALWRNRSVDFEGRWHRIPEAGLNPLPVGGDIPLWIGGSAPVAMARIGRLADGWIPETQPGETLQRNLELIARSALAAGRDPASIGMEGRITLRPGDEASWISQTETWRAAGATHMAINTMGQGRTAREHLEAVRRYAEVALGG